MSSPPPPTTTSPGPAPSPPTTTAGNPLSNSDDDTPAAEAEASTNSGTADADLPMTMAASVILTSLPKDARSALEGVGTGGGKDLVEFGKGERKVNVRFRAVGSAPQLKKPVAQVSSSSSFATVVRYLRRVLRLQEHEGVFCYVNSVFAPGLDEGVGNLWRCFKVNEELVVGYSITPAFG